MQQTIILSILPVINSGDPNEDKEKDDSGNLGCGPPLYEAMELIPRKCFVSGWIGARENFISFEDADF